MRDRPNENPGQELPRCANDFIRQLTKKIRYRRKVRQDVQAELTSHFEDELRDCADAQEREQRAKKLIEEFGDAKLLAVLCRRAKKRCRPLWVRAFVRAMQATGVFLLAFVPYTIWFVRGKANPTIDYLPQLNALHRPAGGVEDDAWPHYEMAIRLAVEPNETVEQVPWLRSFDFRGKPLTQQERKALESWASVNSLAWLQLEFAASKRQCHRVYRRDSGRPLLMNVSQDCPLENLKWLVYLGRCKIRLALERGRIDDSLGYCLTLLRTGAHWQRNALLIEQLLGMAIGSCACQDIRHAVSTEQLSLAQLAEVQTRIAAAYQDEYPYVDFDGARLVMLDAVQHSFTNGGLGGGHYLIGGYTWLAIADRPVGWPRKTMVMSLDVTTSMIHARRNRTIVKINEWYDRMNQIARLPPYERRERCVRSLNGSMGWVERLRYSLIWLLMPAERRASEISFRARADYEALVTVIALKRYRLEKGDYPASLEALVRNGYIETAPPDPYSAGTLVYKPTDDDFILYSLGANFTDDGGEPGRNKEGGPKLWGVSGDVVFWPVGP